MMEFLIFVAVAFSLPALVLGLLQLVAPNRRFTRECGADWPSSSSGS